MKGLLVLSIFCAAVVYGKHVEFQEFGDFDLESDNSPSKIVKEAIVVEERDGLPVVYGYQDGDDCPAQRFYNDCNQCACGENGHSAACTRMECVPKPVGYEMGKAVKSFEEFSHNAPVAEEKNGMPVVYGYENGDKCPAQRFYNKCNKCACGNDGHSAACTRMACPPNSIPYQMGRATRSFYDFPHNDLFGVTHECKPGKSFKHECNTCRCFENGKGAACTDMACPGYYEIAKPHIDGYQSGEACVAGETFYNKCNSCTLACTCGPNGRSAYCTLMVCE